MATILAHIRVKPGADAAFEEIARQLFRATHERETGVRRYEYWRGAEPHTYYTLLAFDDFRAFIAHQTSDHHETAAPEIGRVVEAVRLEWVDPVKGACDLSATESQMMPADANELTRRYAERFAAHIADWWAPLR